MPKLPEKPYETPDTATACNLSPLEILLWEMRAQFHTGDKSVAVTIARFAAPYLHPRIPAAASPRDLACITDADLDEIRPEI